MSENTISRISKQIMNYDYNGIIDKECNIQEIDFSLIEINKILSKEKDREELTINALSNKNSNENIYTFDLIEYLTKIRENISHLENYIESLETQKRLYESNKRLSFL